MKYCYETRAIAAAFLGMAIAGACNRVTSPSPATTTTTTIPPLPPPPVPAPAPAASVSGTVWVHRTNGITPMSGGRLSGWIQQGGNGSTIGWAMLDAAGRYSVSAPMGADVRIFAGDPYQPCQMLQTNLTTAVTRDVHVIGDPSRLGARLPAELLNDVPRLSGTVFESGSAGRRPLSDVELELDGLYGLGLVSARTRTDSEGRYVFCGMGGDSSTYLFASTGGSIRFEGTVRLNRNGDTLFDIELAAR